MPTADQCAYIAEQCRILQGEMLQWGRNAPDVRKFDGTLRSLIIAYQTDADSNYRKIVFKTRRNYDYLCGRLLRDYGPVHLGDIKGRVLKRWHEGWSESGISVAHGLVSMLRTLATFGMTMLEDAECVRLKVLLHNMKFLMSPPRKERLTAGQAIAIRAKAHEMGFPEIALAQAFGFDCTFRQGDVIGQWVPLSEPITSDVIDPATGTKWYGGLRWSEIDGNLILTHVTSKKRKEVVIDLKLAPMVMEELNGNEHVGASGIRNRLDVNWHGVGGVGDVSRGLGPVIIEPKSGLPYRAHNFRRKWRRIARAAGVPDHVWNMDTRAGAITEATDSGAPLEDVKHAAAHSDARMTARYSRGPEGKIASVMRSRVTFRNRPKTSMTGESDG